jgi:hypothetical protein
LQVITTKERRQRFEVVEAIFEVVEIKGRIPRKVREPSLLRLREFDEGHIAPFGFQLRLNQAIKAQVWKRRPSREQDTMKADGNDPR